MARCKKAVMFGLGFVLSLSVAVADSRYVTDSVSVAVFPSKELIGEPVERMLSGDLVEVLDDEGALVHIRTQGGSEGWVRASFLVNTVPAAVTLLEVNDQLERLKKTLFDTQEALLQMEASVEKSSTESNASAKDVGWLKAELKKARSAVAAVEKNLLAKKAELTEAQAKLVVLEAELGELKGQHEDKTLRLAAAVMIADGEEVDKAPAMASSGGFVWGLIAVILALGAGFFGGYRWLDAKVRRRFGGIKVY